MRNMSEERSELRDHSPASAAVRQAVYALLAGAFSSPPAAESLAAWRELLAQEATAALLGEAPARALAAALEKLEGASDALRDSEQEFMNLFKVPGGQYLAPYESVYRDTRDIEGQQVSGLLMGQSAIDVQKWYRLAAVEISPDQRELPDHIGLELGFLAHLCDKEQQFAAARDRARQVRAGQMQRDFLAAHPAAWIGPLRDRLYEKSADCYLRTMADLAVEFLGRDLAALERALGPSQRTSAPAYASAPI